MWFLVRLDKFCFVKSTQLTKTEAIEMIAKGHVEVNGHIVRIERSQVHESNSVTLNGDLLTLRPFRYLVMNKPANTICSNIDEAYPSLFNLCRSR